MGLPTSGREGGGLDHIANCTKLIVNCEVSPLGHPLNKIEKVLSTYVCVYCLNGTSVGTYGNIGTFDIFRWGTVLVSKQRSLLHYEASCKEEFPV